MNRSMQTLSAATLAFALLAPTAGASQDTHDEHQKAQAANGQPMNHGQMQNMDHSKMQGMDHSNMPGMDHSKMQNMDHGKMDNGAKPEAERKDDQ